MWAPRRAMTKFFEIRLMAFETCIPQFHKSLCTTTVEVLWLSKKPQFYCLKYICVHGEASTFVCLFHWAEHMIVTEGHVLTAGEMWKLPTETVAASDESFFQDWVWHCYGGEPNHAIACLRLSAFIAHFKCSGVSSWRSALTLMPLGKQSIRRGLRRSKNIVSITLPELGMTRLSVR
jgi:hypothetical protein